MERPRTSPIIISIVIVLLVAATAGAISSVKAKSPQSTTGTNSGTATNTSSSQSTGTPSNYKNGSYTADGSYLTPGGYEDITVNVTLTNQTISSIESTGSSGSQDSEYYQSQFLSNYKPLVVGKSLDSISLYRVAGSSLTSDGFNRAIDKIKNEATS